MVVFSEARRFAQAVLVKSRISWLFFLFTFAPQSSKVSPTKFNSDDGHSVRCCGDLPQRAAGGARLRRYSVPITVLSRAPKLLVSGRRCRVRPISRCGYITIFQKRGTALKTACYICHWQRCAGFPAASATGSARIAPLIAPPYSDSISTVDKVSGSGQKYLTRRAQNIDSPIIQKIVMTFPTI